MKTPSPTRPRMLGYDANVFFLGVVSFLQDVSSEMIFTIMPLFLANVLGVKTTVIGLYEGVADSTSSLLKIPSGWLGARGASPKPATATGYTLSTIVKPFLYFATSWGFILLLRFIDRVGKGVRTSPRDALIAESVSPLERGQSFGFHRAADTLGAVVGLGGEAGKADLP